MRTNKRVSNKILPSGPPKIQNNKNKTGKPKPFIKKNNNPK
jgi:hypothetical protein